MHEVLLAATDKGQAHVLDAASGGALRVLKDCRPAGGGGLCAGDAFALSAERGRSFIHAWSWRKEQPRYRCQAPERVTCLTCTADGLHCAAGGESGKLYLWQVPTGALLLSWDAHFKAATALQCALSDGFLLSAGEDAIMLAWNLAELLGAVHSRAPPPPPFRTWSEHTLPISALAVAPCGQHDLICSASADQTVRLWRLSEASKGSLHVAGLPCALTCLAIHPHHSRVYAGGANGAIYHVPLLADDGPGSGSSMAAAASAASAAGVGGAAASMAAAAQHTQAVRGLCASLDGLRLFSCASEPGIKVWDAHTLSLLQHLLPTVSVDAIRLLPPPPCLLGEAEAEGAAATSGSREAAALLLAPLKKYASQPGADGEADRAAMGCVPCFLGSPHDGGAAHARADVPADLPLFATLAADAAAGWAADGGDAAGDWCGGGAAALGFGGAGLGVGGADAAAAEASVRQLRAQLNSMHKLNTELYEMAADATLGPAAVLP